MVYTMKTMKPLLATRREPSPREFVCRTSMSFNQW